jgi:DNA-directed RNA polymerase specialized sigma24 family protein
VSFPQHDRVIHRATQVSETQTEREWVLTAAALDRFLCCLADDPEQAGKKYEVIRQKLVKIFDWRGVRFPDECADETINRVARKLEAGQSIRDVATYCQGVARLVFLETLKRADHRQVSLDELTSDAAHPPLPEYDDGRMHCFEKCLEELPLESRQLVLKYYQDDRRAKIDNRQAMADLLKIPLNALRSRVQRIRNRLEQCTTKCLSMSDML